MRQCTDLALSVLILTSSTTMLIATLIVIFNDLNLHHNKCTDYKDLSWTRKKTLNYESMLKLVFLYLPSTRNLIYVHLPLWHLWLTGFTRMPFGMCKSDITFHNMLELSVMKQQNIKFPNHLWVLYQKWLFKKFKMSGTQVILVK